MGVHGGLLTRLFWRPPRHRTGMAALAPRSFASIAPAADGGGGSSNEDGGRSKGWEDWRTKQKEAWQEPHVLLAAAALLVAAATFWTTFWTQAADQEYAKSRRRQVDMALAKLSTVFSPKRDLEGGYIKRDEADNDIREYITRPKPDQYFVVTAPKGCGKTTAIHYALDGRVGVVVVKVQAMAAMPDIKQLLVSALGVSDGKVVDGNAEDFIEEVCTRFAHEHPGLKPVFVFNIEGDPENAESLAKQLGHLQKALSSDSNQAHTIADISAIAFAAGMTNDPRAKFVNIPSMTRDEALELLEPFAQKLQKKGVLVEVVVKKIGGNPASLMAVARDPNPRDIIANMLNDAELQVEAYVRAHPAHKEALRQLLLMPFDEGVPGAAFERIVEAEAKKLKLVGEAATAHSASLSHRVIHTNMQNENIVVHNFPQYYVGQRLAKQWAEAAAAEEAAKRLAAEEKRLAAEEEEAAKRLAAKRWW